MSVCAVSLTELPRFLGAGQGSKTRISLLRRPEWSGHAKEYFLSSPARSCWIAPGRIEYMSTQRRENRSFERARCAVEDRTVSPTWAGWPQLSADGSPHTQARSACISDILPWVYPRFGSRRSTSVIGTSNPPIASPSGLPRLHLTLPLVPTANRCRTERYDGKGNLHLQHAA